jgi:hypothetical protein
MDSTCAGGGRLQNHGEMEKMSKFDMLAVLDCIKSRVNQLRDIEAGMNSLPAEEVLFYRARDATSASIHALRSIDTYMETVFGSKKESKSDMLDAIDKIQISLDKLRELEAGLQLQPDSHATHYHAMRVTSVAASELERISAYIDSLCSHKGGEK